MCSLTKGAWCVVLGALIVSCGEKHSVTSKSFYNVDSLISIQIASLKDRELAKSVMINGKSEATKFTPDSLRWANELEIFRQLAEVNKPSFRDTYVVAEIRDTNSNLMVREIKSQGNAPVSLMRLYYLRTLSDVRKIEATLVEENSLYTNISTMSMEFERNHVLHRYRVEGSQKMVMDDSIRFTVAGIVE